MFKLIRNWKNQQIIPALITQPKIVENSSDNHYSKPKPKTKTLRQVSSYQNTRPNQPETIRNRT